MWLVIAFDAGKILFAMIARIGATNTVSQLLDGVAACVELVKQHLQVLRPTGSMDPEWIDCGQSELVQTYDNQFHTHTSVC